METQNPKILIIEDNDEIRESTAEILQLSEYIVYTAENGKLGVEYAQKYMPDIILCDIMMPELDGYGVLYLLSKNEKTRNIPFIFLTAKIERSDIRKAMEMGADDYLTKPFDDIELLNAIEVRLKKRQAQNLQNSTNHFGPFIEDNEKELIDLLLQKSRSRKYKKQQNIYHQGDDPYFLMYVVQGKVRGYLHHRDGRELVTEIYKEGDFFGYESLLIRQTYSHNAETMEESEIAQISKDDFQELLRRKPSLASKFLKILSGEIVYKDQKLLGLAYDSVRKKVANALVHVAENSITEPEQDQCLIRISRDNLSALAGTANETISRMLSDFIDEDLISKEGNAIRVHSIKKLKSIKH